MDFLKTHRRPVIIAAVIVAVFIAGTVVVNRLAA